MFVRWHTVSMVMLVALLGGFLFTVDCRVGAASLAKHRRELVVGKDIALTEVDSFYYTLDASTNPPLWQRYRFSTKDGKYTFYHEKREGKKWPLTEKDITVRGEMALTADEWGQFCTLLQGGKVTRREEEITCGGSGPWLFLYWQRDKGIYQVFAFATLQQRKDFTKLCERIRRNKE